jgi:hypothetical protein
MSGASMHVSQIREKDKAREEIERLTEKFLSGGRKVQKVSTTERGMPAQMSMKEHESYNWRKSKIL